MGLLDALTSAYGQGGGLLSYLQSPLYPSPLNQPQEAAPQGQYDAMGNYTGVTPQAPASPFPAPDLTQWAQQFAPKSAFNGLSPATPVQFAAGPAAQPAAVPQAAPAQPAPSNAVNDIPVGGYAMPRVGALTDWQNPTSTDISAQSRGAPQPQPAPQQQALPGQFGQGQGSGFGGQALTALQSFLNGGGLISSIRGAANGQRTDPAGMAQQNLKAQYDALVPVVGPQKAMLAVMNPEAGKTILAQALEKKQYGFQKLDSDTVLRTDPLTGKAEVAYGGGEDSKSIPGPDGKPIQIPPGLDAAARKVFTNEVARASAKASAGEKTEVQAKAEIFANKMEQSNKAITDGVGTSLTGKIASGLPLGNYVQSPEYQKYKQASSNFITALLRQESGAAISKSEFDRYDKEYMPQPGDSTEVLSQKTEARRIAIEGMKKGAGPGYKSPTAAALPTGWSVQVR